MALTLLPVCPFSPWLMHRSHLFKSFVLHLLHSRGDPMPFHRSSGVHPVPTCAFLPMLGKALPARRSCEGLVRNRLASSALAACCHLRGKHRLCRKVSLTLETLQFWKKKSSSFLLGMLCSCLLHNASSSGYCAKNHLAFS